MFRKTDIITFAYNRKKLQLTVTQNTQFFLLGFISKQWYAMEVAHFG